MVLRAPEWLVLVPVILLAGWFFPRLAPWRPLRLLCLVLLSLLLADPSIQRYKDGLDLWVLMDQSESMEDRVSKGRQEWMNLLERSRRSSDDRINALDYAGEVMKHGETGAELYDRNKKLSRTSLAIETATALAEKDKPGRVLVFTDGFSTEPLTGLAEKLTDRGLTLDYRFVRSTEARDFRVSRLQLPEKAQLGEPFLIQADIVGTEDGKVPIVISRSGKKVMESEVEVKLGRAMLRFTDRIPVSGSFNYQVQLNPDRDASSGNNRHEAWIEITGGPRVLLVTEYSGQDPVATALEQQGFTVQTITNARTAEPGHLSGAKAVILNNVAAWNLTQDFLNSLKFYVQEQGGSLLMAGGNQSFGAGGFFESPIDPILPVSMEMKVEHRKLSVAMAIIMDRSGSMGMSVAGGMTKMDLANEGAANAVNFLGAQDSLTVFAVDSTPHEMVPLQNVGENRAKMASAIRRIESTGGGIFVYEGLKAGWDALKTTTVGQRHMILFSDAADSEEPGSYESLLEEVTKNGATVSVIALGTRSDHDAALLEDIAKRGKGRLFFTDKPAELPSIFSQETIAVARSAFIKDPVATKGAPGWFEISAQQMPWLSTIDGYNLSYLRDWASPALISQDEYTAPLVAFGQRGLGRTAAVTFPLGGEYSQQIRAWPKYGDFLQTLTRWLMGESLPPGLGLKHSLQGNTLSLDLLYDDTWETKLAAKAPKIILASGARADETKELAWRRLAPGHYQATAELEEGQMIRGAVQAGGSALPFGPLVAGTSAEWAFDPLRAEELRQLATATGGGELINLDQAWRNPPVKRYTDVRPWLIVLALLAMLIEALTTRTGWKMPSWGLSSWKDLLPERSAKLAKAPKLKPAAVKVAPAPAAAVQSPAAPAPDQLPASTASEERRSRFARAKK